MTNLSTDILTETIKLFHSARASLLEAAAGLYQVRQTEAWSGRYNDFNEFLEACQIDRTQASRLITVYEHYCINGGYSVSQLTGTNPERLYLARKSSESLEEQVANAQTHTVAGLKDAHNQLNPHDPDPITICGVCKMKLIDGKHPYDN